ncbi:MAG: hypothetical protein JO023_24990 [Chloroflexi bacterium]|nr:hypothetical protein [Chloroflexota bacterium]
MPTAELRYPASSMGPCLRVMVEQQLLEDLRHYGVASDGLALDWSHPCQEGHWTEYLDGSLEEMSDVAVRDRSGEAVAKGWIDFVHPAADGRLVVFWLFLRLRRGQCWHAAKNSPTIPAHVWQQLSERSKADVATDARWHADPLVLAWQSAR